MSGGIIQFDRQMRKVWKLTKGEKMSKYGVLAMKISDIEDELSGKKPGIQWREAKIEDALNAKIAVLEKRLKQLECHHENVEFEEPKNALGIASWSICFSYGLTSQYREVCQDCNKELRTFDTEKEFLVAKLEDQKSKCSGDMAETKARLKALKPQSTGLK